MATTSKKTSVLQFVFALTILTTACNNSTTTSTGTSDSTSASAVTDTAGNKMQQAAGSIEAGANKAATAVEESVAKNPDSSFVTEVAVANSAEINMLQAAIDKGSDKAVKNGARMMIADHKGLKKKLAAYAAKKNYPIASDDEGKAAKELDNMSSKTGKDWDKAWADFMFNAHEKTIGKFEGAQNNVKDDELKAMITSTLPTLHSHLDMVKNIQEKLK